MVTQKLSGKIFLITIIILSCSFIALGVVLYFDQKKNIIESTDERMASQLEDLTSVLNVMVEEKQGKTNSSLIVAHELFKNLGELKRNDTIYVVAINQKNKEKISVAINNWTLGEKQVYQNYDFVDRVQELTSETATIFQKIPQGYLRISTNVKKEDGSRAVGTFIPNSSPVIQTIEQGKTFRGRAYVVNDWYLTAYEPIRIDGEIQGILYVGVKEKDYKTLKSIFDTKSYFKSGYPYLVDTEGTLHIHPSSEGKNISATTFFRQLKASSGSGKSRYLWPENATGEWKQQYFKYFEPYQSYVSVSVYEKDLFKSLASLRNILIFSIIITLVIACSAFAVFLRPIIRDIQQAIAKAGEIATGNLAVTFDLRRKDEIGDLLRSLNEMTQHLKKVILKIQDNSERVSQASDEISKAALSLSQENSEQASVAEEVASSMEEMSSNIRQTTENANETHTISQETFSSIKQGHESTSHSSEAMKLIATKIQVIEEIAFQTNLLALNASVEAARAGVYGAGFSVVASEVRKLADRSKVASDEISQLTHKGLQVASKAGEQLNKNVSHTEKTATLIKEIAIASQEQSASSEQVKNAIDQLNISVQNNAATAEEMASNAQSLNDLAGNLKETVTFFRLEEEH